MADAGEPPARPHHRSRAARHAARTTSRTTSRAADPVAFDELLEAQHGRCAICGAADPRHLDRDHRTGWVRGILCFDCSGGLDRFRAGPRLLAEAITYLKGTTWQRVLIHPGVYQMCSPTRGRPPSRSS